MSKKLVLVGLLLGSSLSYADRAWLEIFVMSGCGSTRTEARKDARAKAKEEASHYEYNCNMEKGYFVSSFSDLDCVENTGEPSCPVSCECVGDASCS